MQPAGAERLDAELQHFRHRLDPQHRVSGKPGRSAEYHRADIIIGGCALIGVVAVLMDRLLLAPLERRTIERWGLVASMREEKLT
jgi:hypothetical protein